MRGSDILTTLSDIAYEYSMTIKQVQQVLSINGIDFLSNTKQLNDMQVSKINTIIKEHVRTQSIIEKLEPLVVQHKIFIDTYSLVEKQSISFLKILEPLLRKYNNKIIIPIRVIEELKKI